MTQTAPTSSTGVKVTNIEAIDATDCVLDIVAGSGAGDGLRADDRE
jgi:hypothetical protein